MVRVKTTLPPPKLKGRWPLSFSLEASDSLQMGKIAISDDTSAGDTLQVSPSHKTESKNNLKRISGRCG